MRKKKKTFIPGKFYVADLRKIGAKCLPIFSTSSCVFDNQSGYNYFNCETDMFLVLQCNLIRDHFGDSYTVQFLTNTGIVGWRRLSRSFYKEARRGP